MKTIQDKFNQFTREVTITDEKFTKTHINWKEQTLFTFNVNTQYASFTDFIILKKRSDIDEKPSITSNKVSEVLANLSVLNQHRVKMKSGLKLKGNVATFKIQISLHLPTVKPEDKQHEIHFSNGKVVKTNLGFLVQDFTIDVAKESVIDVIVKFLNSFTVKSEKKSTFTSFKPVFKKEEVKKIGFGVTNVKIEKTEVVLRRRPSNVLPTIYKTDEDITYVYIPLEEDDKFVIKRDPFTYIEDSFFEAE